MVAPDSAPRLPSISANATEIITQGALYGWWGGTGTCRAWFISPSSYGCYRMGWSPQLMAWIPPLRELSRSPLLTKGIKLNRDTYLPVCAWSWFPFFLVTPSLEEKTWFYIHWQCSSSGQCWLETCSRRFSGWLPPVIEISVELSRPKVRVFIKIAESD